MDDTNVPLDDITTSTDTPVVVEEVPAVVEEVPYITTIGELVSIREAVIQKEQKDKDSLLSVFVPASDVLRQKLYSWAVNGFPAMSTLFSTQIIPPGVCSDNTQRDLIPYIEFLLDSQTLSSLIQSLELRVEGIKFSYNIIQYNVICLTVIKS
jgi:hypothetical protein